VFVFVIDSRVLVSSRVVKQEFLVHMFF